MIKGIWHVSWTVKNIERSIAFYTTLGFEQMHYQESQNEYTDKLVGLPDTHLKAAMLKFADVPPGLSGHAIELIEYVKPVGEHLRYKPCDINASHLALITDDVKELHERMEGAGAAFVSPPVAITEGMNKGGYTCYMRDLDGYIIELMQPPVWRLEGKARPGDS